MSTTEQASILNLPRRCRERGICTQCRGAKCIPMEHESNQKESTADINVLYYAIGVYPSKADEAEEYNRVKRSWET